MKTYVALDRDNRTLVTVIAHDEQEAAEKIRAQLDRPGRRAYLAQWLAGGETRDAQTRITRRPAMRECVNHRMTVARLARFISANGLRLDGHRLFAPTGEHVGIVRHARGGPLVLQVFQEQYRLPRAGSERLGAVRGLLPHVQPALPRPHPALSCPSLRGRRRGRR